MNLPLAISLMHQADAPQLLAMGELIGLLTHEPESWFKGKNSDNNGEIQSLIQQRIDAKKAKDFAESDRIRQLLESQGIILEDKRDGTTNWRRE